MCLVPAHVLRACVFVCPVRARCVYMSVLCPGMHVLVCLSICAVPMPACVCEHVCALVSSVHASVCVLQAPSNPNAPQHSISCEEQKPRRVLRAHNTHVLLFWLSPVPAALAHSFAC